MTQLYRHKWSSSEGEMLNPDGKYSDTFMLWCRKTEHLTDDEWAYAFESMERDIAKNKQNGVESWPPSYAEFTAMANKTISPDGMNSDAYLSPSDPRHSQHQYWLLNRTLKLEDGSVKERKKKTGNDHLKNLKESL